MWTGTLRVEGGGFCGARARRLDLDLASFDGISLRVRGDGQTFKLNLKTVRALRFCLTLRPARLSKPFYAGARRIFVCMLRAGLS